MRYLKETKIYSLKEIVSSIAITRKELLEYEKIGLVVPYYKDKDSSYRYYEPTIFIKLNLIKKLLNCGLSLQEIKLYFDNNLLTKKEILNSLNLRKNNIEDAIQLFSKNKSIVKKNLDDLFYYYEERNLIDLNLIEPLFKEIYIHALEKKYIFSSFEPFIIFPLDILNKDKISVSIDNPIKTKFCIPIKIKYDEKNISEIKKGTFLIYNDNTSSFLTSLNNIKIIIKTNNLKCKNILLYSYSMELNLNHKFLIPLF